MIDHVLLTGAGSGIGRAIAMQLAEMRIPMLLAGRSTSSETTRGMVLDKGGSAEVYECDLEDHARIRRELPAIIASKPARNWGAVLAASTLDVKADPEDSRDYDRVFRTNVTGNLAVLEACLPQMVAARFGRVLFFAGGGAAYAYPAFPGYALSKVSTVRLVENLASKHGSESGISFVCLAPGAVETPMLARVVAAGGEVKTKTSVQEPVEFATHYLSSHSMALNGRYVHVRDDWRAVLNGSSQLSAEQFFLRRIQ